MLVALSVGAITSCATSVSGNRAVAADGRSIHRANQLDDFILEKPVSVQGLGTKAALENLDREYRSSCRKAGAVPLDLTYDVPAGYERPLKFEVNGTFEHALREIAAVSGLEWKRSGNAYRFQAPEGVREGGGLTQETLSVPPDFLSRVAGSGYEHTWSARGAFEKRGVSFDPSTRLKMTGTSLHVESRSPADRVVVSGMVDAITGETPLQIRTDAQTFEVPAGQSWQAPANGMVTDSQLADLRRIPGVRETAYPPLSSRHNERGQFEFQGETLRLQPKLLGLGVQVDAALTPKTRGARPGTIAMEGQSPDGGTRVATITRADGSRAILALTTTIIDATGRSVKQAR